jgi:hypothetical protein
MTTKAQEAKRAAKLSGPPEKKVVPKLSPRQHLDRRVAVKAAALKAFPLERTVHPERTKPSTATSAAGPSKVARSASRPPSR